MQIRLVSDIICPWCYIGKVRIQNAIEESGKGDQVSIDISPYQLYPKTPSEGRKIRKYKSKDDVLEVLRAAGARLGIEFRFDLIDHIPNTLHLHSLLMRLDLTQRSMLKDRCFEAYFQQGLNLSDDLIIAQLCQSVGVDYAIVTPEEISRTQALIETNADHGVRAVPSFIIEDEHIINGAITTDRWRQFFRKHLD